jgi:adenine-specific DNA-methyltransferase
MPTLDWLDRQAAFSSANKTATHVLRPHAAGHVFGDAAVARNNLLIQGDNLQALKALLPFYRGQVKCIFIDPPYNTKSAFEHYDDNLEHSQWLSMMLPRLQVLRDLLSEDGSIWVTIDDNEGHYLKVLMDEMFGRGNFVSNVIWQKKFSPQNDAKWISNSHDHIHCYAFNKNCWFPNPLPRSAEMDERFKNPDSDPRGPWSATDLTRAEHRDRDYWGLITPSGKTVFPAKGRSWSRPKENIEKLQADGRLWFGPSGNNLPRLKKFLNEMDGGLTPQSIWLHSEVGNNQEAKKEILQFDSERVFDTPKPERLLQRVLHLATNPGDLVLDSFLGSGTTAAVAHKMGRRWIGIEMGEHATTHCTPRLQKVIDGEQGGISTAVGWQGGGGFQLLQLGAPLFDEQGDIHPEVRFADLAAFIWMRETGTALPAQAASGPLPLLGVHEGTAYYLLFNGILGDRRPASGNVLTTAVLQALKELCGHDGPKVIYGEACRLGDARLKAEGISFKQLPHAVPR